MMANGTIAGTPTAAGGFSFTMTATDKNGFSGSRAYSVTVAPPVLNDPAGQFPSHSSVSEPPVE